MHLDVTIRVGDLEGFCTVTDNGGSSTDAVATSQLREILCVVLWSFVLFEITKKHKGQKSTLNSPVFWDVTQRRLVWHRRFGTTYRSHLQVSSCPSSWTA